MNTKTKAVPFLQLWLLAWAESKTYQKYVPTGLWQMDTTGMDFSDIEPDEPKYETIPRTKTKRLLYFLKTIFKP